MLVWIEVHDQGPSQLGDTRMFSVVDGVLGTFLEISITDRSMISPKHRRFHIKVLRSGPGGCYFEPALLDRLAHPVCSLRR